MVAISVIAETMPRCVTGVMPSTAPIGNPVNATSCPRPPRPPQRGATPEGARSRGAAGQGPVSVRWPTRTGRTAPVRPSPGRTMTSASIFAPSISSGRTWALVATSMPSPTANRYPEHEGRTAGALVGADGDDRGFDARQRRPGLHAPPGANAGEGQRAGQQASRAGIVASGLKIRVPGRRESKLAQHRAGDDTAVVRGGDPARRDAGCARRRHGSRGRAARPDNGPTPLRRCGRGGQRNVALEIGQQPAQVGEAATDVLLGIVGLADVEALSAVAGSACMTPIAFLGRERVGVQADSVSPIARANSGRTRRTWGELGEHARNCLTRRRQVARSAPRPASAARSGSKACAGGRHVTGVFAGEKFATCAAACSSPSRPPSRRACRQRRRCARHHARSRTSSQARTCPRCRRGARTRYSSKAAYDWSRGTPAVFVGQRLGGEVARLLGEARSNRPPAVAANGRGQRDRQPQQPRKAPEAWPRNAGEQGGASWSCP